MGAIDKMKKKKIMDRVRVGVLTLNSSSERGPDK